MLPLARRLAALLLLPATVAHAGLFDDDEARQAVLDLRTRVQNNDDAAKARHAEMAQSQAQLLEQLQQLRRSLLELNAALDAQKADNALLRGTQEQLQRDLGEQARQLSALAADLADLQRQRKDNAQLLDERLRRLEPLTVTVDGREFKAMPAEKRAFDAALAELRSGDFDKGAAALASFVAQHPGSGYLDSARFWLANAQYGQKNYKDAIQTFRQLLAHAPEHPRAAEALLGVANCQVEMKDSKAARRTLEELLKTYPSSEAAAAGKERLGTLKG